MAVRLVTFADGRFSKRGVHFVREAEQMDIFASIKVFDRSALPADFVSRHGDFMLNTRRGFGYWIWKPRIVLEVLKSAAPNDIIVYTDAGFTHHPEGRSRYLEYLDIVRDSDCGMLSFANTHTEYHWTKMDLAVRLGVADNSSVMATTQLASGFFMLRPTERNIEIMQQWSDIAVEQDYCFSDDSPSVALNHPGFIEHRHDASIGSLLRKIQGTVITHYEVQPFDQHYEKKKAELPLFAARCTEIALTPEKKLFGWL